METRVYCACAVLMTVSVLPCVAMGQSWDGTWKMNLAKSKVTGDTFVIEDKGTGLMHFAGGSISYDFACDGKVYVSFADRNTTCIKSAKDQYDFVDKAGDKLMDKERWTFSADGKMLTVRGTATRPDGSTSDYEEVYKRESGTTGLMGKWLNVKSESPSDAILNIQTNGDRIKIYSPQYKTTSEGKMDGSDLTVTGPAVAPGVTQSVKPESPNKLHFIVKYQGNVVNEATQTLSADGKTMVEEQWAPGKMNEKVTIVWERQ